MVRLAKGLWSAFLRFAVVGIAIPYAIEYFAPVVSGYITLPSSSEIWEVFILFGTLLAITGFLQNAYSKGEYPWLFGRIGGGLVELGIFYFIFLLLPKSLSSAGAGVESSGLLILAVLAIVLSYGYLIFDFFDARQRLKQKAAPPPPSGVNA